MSTILENGVVIFITLVVIIGGLCLIGLLLKGERFAMHQAASGKTVQVKRGFSFTYLFFGCLVPLFRGHIAGFFLSFFLGFFTCGIAHLVMVFCYNGMYINWLSNNGYTRIETEPEPAEKSREAVSQLPPLKKTVLDKEGKAERPDDVTTALKQGTLVGLNGTYQNARIPLEYGESIIIGRDEKQCNLILSGDQISRKHCLITFDSYDGLFRVTDLSTNGIFLENGERLTARQEVKLPSGSQIRIGSDEHTFLLS